MHNHIEQLKWQMIYHIGSGYRYGKAILIAPNIIHKSKTIQYLYSCKSRIERVAIFSPELESMDIIVRENISQVRHRIAFGMNSNYCSTGVYVQTDDDRSEHFQSYSWHGSGKYSRTFIRIENHNSMSTMCTAACKTSLARDAMLAHVQKVWQKK